MACSLSERLATACTVSPSRIRKRRLTFALIVSHIIKVQGWDVYASGHLVQQFFVQGDFLVLVIHDRNLRLIIIVPTPSAAHLQNTGFCFNRLPYVHQDGAPFAIIIIVWVGKIITAAADLVQQLLVKGGFFVFHDRNLRKEVVYSDSIIPQVLSQNNHTGRRGRSVFCIFLSGFFFFITLPAPEAYLIAPGTATGEPSPIS
jgi:hypothetical protein